MHNWRCCCSAVRCCALWYSGIWAAKCRRYFAAFHFTACPYNIGITYTMYPSFLKATFKHSLRNFMNVLSQARVQWVLRSRQILPSPPLNRNTLIHEHMNSHTVLTCSIGLDWQCYLRLKNEARWNWSWYIKFEASFFFWTESHISVLN